MTNLSLAEKAQRAALRRTQRDISRWPLLELGGNLHHWTGDEMLAEWNRYATKLEESEARLFAQGISFRERVARLVSPDELARMDVRRKMYPPATCYSADFWRIELIGLDAVEE